MPPFRTGLLKRKNSDKEVNVETAQTPEDEVPNVLCTLNIMIRTFKVL